jgi:bla regulator protein blaR1
LPPDALAWSAAELNRTIVHELEHVRRRDWLSQCVARFVCAVYWFHPLIWIAHRQLALEAERACDDAVLWRAEATDYADQLVALAKRISISARLSAPAMASRSDLAARVGAVLDSHQRRGRAGATWVIAAFAVSAFIAAAVSPLTIVAIGQGVSGKFEVASVKPCTTGEILPTRGGGARGGGYGGGRFGTSPDTLTVTCMTVEEMTHLAYAASGNALLNDPRRPNELRVEGGPEWVYKDRWSVEAKAAAPTERRVMTGAMLQSLLEGRFQLQQHRGTQQEQMYGLVAAKSGMKIRPIEPGGCVNRATASAEQKGDLATFFCGTTTSVDEGRVTIRIGGTTLARFASVLSGYADRAVIDKTGQTGLFNITIAFAPMTAPPSETSAEPLVSALERQLGLKLEQARGPAEHLVIDRVEKPRIN